MQRRKNIFNLTLIKVFRWTKTADTYLTKKAMKTYLTKKTEGGVEISRACSHNNQESPDHMDPWWLMMPIVTKMLIVCYQTDDDCDQNYEYNDVGMLPLPQRRE